MALLNVKQSLLNSNNITVQLYSLFFICQFDHSIQSIGVSEGMNRILERQDPLFLTIAN
jgi:DNA phosphorothioation-dependent restriction protein DptG